MLRSLSFSEKRTTYLGQNGQNFYSLFLRKSYKTKMNEGLILKVCFSCQVIESKEIEFRIIKCKKLCYFTKISI